MIIVATMSLPAVDCPNKTSRTTTAGTTNAHANTALFLNTCIPWFDVVLEGSFVKAILFFSVAFLCLFCLSLPILLCFLVPTGYKFVYQHFTWKGGRQIGPSEQVYSLEYGAFQRYCRLFWLMVLWPIKITEVLFEILCYK